MITSAFRFEFQPAIAISEVEMTLHLALYAVEGLFGEARVRLETTYRTDEDHHLVTLDGSTEVGAAIVKVFTRLLIREFGEDSFQVRGITQHVACAAAAAE